MGFQISGDISVSCALQHIRVVKTDKGLVDNRDVQFNSKKQSYQSPTLVRDLGKILVGGNNGS